MRSWRPPYPIYDQNYSKAIKYYEKSASFGNPQALKNLGNLYFFGKGVKQNLNKAREYFDKAVQGNSDVFDFNGNRFNQDLDKTTECYEKEDHTN